MIKTIIPSKYQNKAVVIAHKMMLIIMLHSSFIAPSQSLISAYINRVPPLRYLGSSLPNYNTSLNETQSNLINNPHYKQNIVGQSTNDHNNSKPLINSNNTVIPFDIQHGVIGVSKQNPLDDPKDNFFKFILDNKPESKKRYFLSYELYGVQDNSAVSRSINDHFATGGYIVKQQQSWSLQKEELNPLSLKTGINKIMFSIPKGAEYQYEVRNLKIEVQEVKENAVLPLLVLNNSNTTYVKDNKMYVKGFLRRANNTTTKVYIEDQTLLLNSDEFEGFITITPELKSRKFLVVKAIDSSGLLGQEIVPIDTLNEADTLFPIEPISNRVAKRFEISEAAVLEGDGASVELKQNSLSETKEISISKLRNIDIAPLSSGMINVTRGGVGYRFLPDGTKFKSPVLLKIAYDEKLLPKGYGIKDIKTFYFNTDSKSWVAVKRDTINEKEKTVSVLTTHFTDYINGIIQAPESPETAGFTSTMMNDIKAADPSSEMTIISPPEVSQKGDANVSYPIKIPAGRKGMQPQLAVQYNNNGGNGWLGLGWNISTPAITIDTRWGTPTFDATNESEIYTLGGDQLMYPQFDGSDWMPNRHREITLQSGETSFDTAPMARTYGATGNVKLFTPRKQGSFAKIERLGTSPSTYFWKVTNTDGSKNWYGGYLDHIESNSVLKDSNNNIVHWALFMSEDVYGNNVIYHYLNTIMVGNGNLDGGKIFNVDSISYTGKNGTEGNYYMKFNNETTTRTDVNINARLGIKQIEPYRLESIAVGNGSQLIRTYRFNYIYGRFQKSLLNKVTEFDANNTEFYNHKFDYYDDLAGEKAVLFDTTPIKISVPTFSPQFTLEMGNTLGASRINANETIQSEWGVTPAAGINLFQVSNDPMQIFTIGAPFGESNTKSKSKITLKDMDGNGLDDIVYRKDDNLYYLPHFKDSIGTSFFNDTPKNIFKINNFYRSSGWTKTMFGESWDFSFLYDGYFGTKRFKTSDDTNIYFTDGNGDGLPDIVNDDKVYFNTLDASTGNITYDTSSQSTPNMLITASPNTIPATQFPSQFHENGSNEYDVVRVWEAPREGIIGIDDIIQFFPQLPTDKITYSIETTHGSITNPCQPFRIYLKQFDNLNTLDNFQLTSYYGNNPPLGYNTVSSCNPQTNTFGMHVFEGQKIYFRLHKSRNNSNEILRTDPYIHYLSGYNSPYPINYRDQNNNDLNNTCYNDAFILSDNEDALVQNTGHYSINWDFFNINQLSDDVTIKIERIETAPNTAPIITTIYEKLCPQNTTTIVNTSTNSLQYDITNINYSAIATGHSFLYRFYINSDSNVIWKNIHWRPSLEYTPDSNAIAQGVPNETSIRQIVPLYNIYREKNNEFLNINTTLSYPNWNPPTGNQTFSVLPKYNKIAGTNNLLTAADTGSFLFIVKKSGNTIGKIKVDINAGDISLSGIASQQVPITFNTNMYSVNNLSYQFVVSSSNAALFAKYNHDVTYGIPIDSFGYKNVILGYGNISFSSGILSPVLTSTNYVNCNSTTLFKKNPVLGPMYKNWGQFIYNADSDNNNSIPQDTYSKLINNDLLNGYDFTGIANVLGINLSACNSNDPAVVQACTLNAINTTLNLPPASSVNSSNIASIVNSLQANLSGLTPPQTSVIKMRAFRTKDKISYPGEIIKTIDKWIGLYDSQYSNDYEMRDGDFGSSYLGNFLAGSETDSPLLEGNSLTGMNAITKNHKSVARSWTGGWGPTNFSHSESSYSVTTADFMDLNGDKYPDIFSNELIQPTNMTGGHRPQIAHSWSDLTASDNKSNGISTSGGAIIAGIKEVAALSKSATATAIMGKIQAKLGNIANRMGISANLGGVDKENYFWSDLNGDGLPDRVIETGGNNYSYQLNLGKNTDNNFYENFNYLNGSESKPTTFAASLTVPYSINLGSIPFNISSGCSKNAGNSTITFQDINSDGLVDILVVPTNGNPANVRFNTGNGFSSMQNESINTNKNLNENYSLSFSGSGSRFWGFPICCLFTNIIYLKFGATLSGSSNLTVSDVHKSYSDFNGDGYTDYIESSGTDINVYPSLIRRTNMLKQVINPLKGDFVIDYEPSAVSFQCPNAKWVMKSLIISDNYNLQNDGEDQYRKNFTYENAYYDRRERDFYGYEIVKTADVKMVNATLQTYRTSVSKYHNESYFLNGLLKESYVMKGNNENQKYSKTKNFYEVRQLSDNNQEMNGIVLSNLFDVGGKEGRKSAAVVMTKTISELYELAPSPQITTQVEMQYDDKGRVINYSNLGNTALSNDNYSAVIAYHNLANNIINVPREIKVLVNGTSVRRRTTEVNPNTGSLITVAAFNGSEVSQTTLNYDQFGNVIHAEHPANAAGERMYYDYTYDSLYHKYVTKIKDAFGYSSSADYNSNFDKIHETIALTGNKMLYEYDTFGRNTTITAPKEVIAGKPYTIKFDYYPYFSLLPANSGVSTGNFVPVAVTNHYDQQHPGNDIQTYTFIDGLARPIQIKKDITLNSSQNHQEPNYYEALSVSGKTYFDEFGRAIKQFHPNFETKTDARKFLLNEDPSPYSTTTLLDELDRPVKTIDPENNISTLEYSIAGDNTGEVALKTKSTTDQNGSQSIVTETYKNVSGKVIATINLGATALWTNFNYDAIGQLMNYKDAQDIVTQYEYDLLGRKIAVHHPDNGTTTFKYDTASNLIKLQTANLAADGTSVNYNYQYNRLQEIVYPVTPSGQNLSNVNYVYGDSGNNAGQLIYQSDATGHQEFSYGNMGEVVGNVRTVIAPNLLTRVFKTSYNYDSWNRLQTMIYPDQEKVNYSYDLGGNLTRMTGQVYNEPYNYIDRIDYDYYEQRAYLLYGNKTETFYNYTPKLRRLENLNVKTADAQDLYNNFYKYDKVGNVTSLINQAGPTANTMGGSYGHGFIYDNLNRLASASGYFNGNQAQQQNNNDFQSDYTINMQYNATHGIENKTQLHYKNMDATPVAANTYSNTYEYEDHTHKVVHIDDSTTGATEDFSYDLNGNLIYKTNTDGNERSLYWDESNRLRVVSDRAGMQHYIYDASGERILKANTNTEAVYGNGSLLDPATITINSYTTYPSANLVIDAQGIYSKHYYAGTQRIVSRIGEQNSSIFGGDCTGCKTTETDKKLQELQKNNLQQILAKGKLGQAAFKPYQPYTYEEAQKALAEEDKENLKETLAPPLGAGGIYFYHPDHLGTSTFLTDYNGNAYQFFLNLPFGETMAEQLGSNYYNTPFKFNGKELDEETGLYYYGARYYDPRVSIWLSTDPLAEVQPGKTPYHYCSNNPISRTDPTGLIDGEFEKDKDGKWQKTSTKGDDIGLDFYHTDNKDKDGNQITIAKDKSNHTAIIPNGREKLSGAKREATVDWSDVYNEWKNDTGPEKSYFEAYHPVINDIKANHLWGSAYSDFLDSGKKSDVGVLSHFVPILDNWLTADNMQVQMMGSFRTDFYKMGGNVLNIVTDTKSRTSFYLHLPVSNYRRGQGIIDKNGMWYPPRKGENTTFQTYLFLTTPKK